MNRWKWEYYVLRMSEPGAAGAPYATVPCVHMKELDTAGLDGWELVTVVVMPDCAEAVFKRVADE
jgi:hypothetical protein